MQSESGEGNAPGNTYGRLPAHDDPMTAIAHRLRTPLTSIRSLSEILRDNPDLCAAQRGRFLAILAEESKRLDRTIERILRASSATDNRWCVDTVDVMSPCRPADVLSPCRPADASVFAGALETGLVSGR